MFDFIKAKPLRKQSSALLAAGKFDEAIPICQSIVEISPQDATAWNELGSALLGGHRYEAAAAACDRAIFIDKYLAYAWTVKGNAYTATDMLLEINPGDANSWIKRGQVLSALEQYSEAEKAYLEAVRYTPGSDVTLEWLALFYANNSREYSKAIGVCEQLLTLRPNYAHGWGLKGFVRSKQNEFEEALSAYMHAISLTSPADAELGARWNGVGWSLIRLGRYGEALTAFDKSLECSPKYAYPLLNRGVIFSRLGHPKEALHWYEMAQSVQSDLTLAQADMAEALVELGLYDQARAVLNDLFSADGANGCAWYASGLLETALGHYDDAIAAFDRSITLEPTHAPHLSGFAQLLLKLDDAEHAITAIERALKLDPVSAHAWKVKAQALRAAGRIEEADAAERHGAALLADQQAQVDEVDAYFAAKEQGEQ